MVGTAAEFDRGQRWRTRLILGASLLVIALAVWFGAQAQKDASNRTSEERAVAQRLLTARLDMETGLRGFLLTGRTPFLAPFARGREDYERTSLRARQLADGGGQERLLDRQRSLTHVWLQLARDAIRRERAGIEPTTGTLLARKRQMDRFRDVNARFTGEVQRRGNEREREGIVILVAIIAALGVIGFTAGHFLVERPARRTRRRQAQRSEFAETLQFAATEEEARKLVGHHLERTLPGAEATLLAINNSENRLQATTPLPQESGLTRTLRTAKPGTCLAVRRGRTYRRRHDDESLIRCDLCGNAGAAACIPALVGGEIIGSVLVTRAGRGFTSDQAALIEEATTIAAPVLGNLRNLAIAETRAVTDSLTGLSNSRAATETLGVMAAFAKRSGQPLSAVLVDLDHFKQVNDNHGHQVGDEVLAAAGNALRAGLRESDFIARHGGEEFLVLLQGTGKAGAGEIAEKMRRATAQARAPGFAGRVTASLGVATLPDDADDADALLRAADAALYAAKEAGRDRVVLAGDGANLEQAVSGNGGPAGGSLRVGSDRTSS